MKLYDICGLGNGLVDILLEIGEEEFSTLGLEKGTMRLVDGKFQSDLLSRFVERPTHLVSGGSVANSIIAATQLGARGAFIASLGADRYGDFYRDEFKSLGIRLGGNLAQDAPTGTSLALVTPDAERTMRTHLGAAALLSAETVSEELIKASAWLFIEGYVFANPDFGPKAIRRAIELAKANGTKVAITVSEAFIITAFGGDSKECIAGADFVFANESEAAALAGAASGAEAFEKLKHQLPGLAITCGAEGAFIKFNNVECKVGAFPCKPVDLTGAGDVFAGTVLACLSKGIAPAEAAGAGCFMAREIITRYGARLPLEHARASFKKCFGRLVNE